MDCSERVLNPRDTHLKQSSNSRICANDRAATTVAGDRPGTAARIWLFLAKMPSAQPIAIKRIGRGVKESQKNFIDRPRQ